MKAKTAPCTDAPPEGRKRECLPCDIPRFCRNHFFTGKLLTERDFSAEQRYGIDKLRLHHLALHGWGAVCGLGVRPHPYCPEKRIVVDPGLAIDGCGREIYVPTCHELELPEIELEVTPEDPCAPDVDPKRPAPQRHPTYGYPPPSTPAQQASTTDDSPKQDEPTQEAPEVCEPPAPCVAPPLYVCLQYAECETEFMPAPFDECACDGAVQRPNRICESYCLTITTQPPNEWVSTMPPPSVAGCEDKEERIAPTTDCGDQGDPPPTTSDCRDLYWTALKQCPKPFATDCLLLAVITDYTPGQRVTPAMIDNTRRRLLPSTHLLDQVIRCIMDKLPTRTPTRIQDIGWTHGRDYSYRDFVSLFLDVKESPWGFEVTFEKRIRPEGITPETFRAVVVRQLEKGARGGFFELVPTRRVRVSDCRTKAYLQIDPGYAEHCLRGVPFRLYLQLRCDLILDERGCAVDGELTAHLRKDDGTYQVSPPTGDGIPGGLFESWIHVQP